MKFQGTSSRPRIAEQAFAMIEVLIGVCIMGIMMVSLYAGMSSGFAVTKTARENLRATQIMIERMEGIRLFTWNQLCSSNWMPTDFTTYYLPAVGTNAASGTIYRCNVSVTNAGVPASYNDRMRAITITVFWTNYYGKPMTNTIVRSRSMTTTSCCRSARTCRFWARCRSSTTCATSRTGRR